MTIWMDLTNSMRVWQGGVVGIVRAELEIAKNLHKINSSIRFCVCKENGFSEIREGDLEWLWASENVCDAYLYKMGREKSKERETDKTSKDKNALEQAQDFSESRLVRLGEAVKIILSLFPEPIHSIVYYPAKIVYKPLRKVSIYRANKLAFQRNKNNTGVNNIEKIKYPFQKGDMVFSCGWFGSEKEQMFSKVKNVVLDLKIVYLVYDIIILKEQLTHLYAHSQNDFSNYIEWISNNCDYIIYGGNTAQRDTEEYLKEKDLRVPKGDWIKFGSEVGRHLPLEQSRQILRQLKIFEPYILTVGTIEPRKNYRTIYRAYVLMAEKYPEEEIPTLVIVGRETDDKDLCEMMQAHPVTKQKIRILQPSDQELDALYQHCEFTLLPSLYEGWSLTLPESLNYGKLCICSDVPPLREIANDITLFVDPLEPQMWADMIMNLINSEDIVMKWEDVIKSNWQSATWVDCAKMVEEKLKYFLDEQTEKKWILYYDATLIWHSCFANAPVSGILRTQLLMARYLSRIFPTMKFYALTPDNYYEFNRYDLAHILGNEPIDLSLIKDREKIMAVKGCYETKNIKKIYRIKESCKKSFWLICSILPSSLQKKATKLVKQKKIVVQKTDKKKSKYVTPFKEDDIVFSTGTGYTVEVYDSLLTEHRNKKFYFVQLIYDYTPVLMPQTHRAMTLEYYPPFLENSNALSDVIFYGGKTAMHDGILYQKKNNMEVLPAYAMRFGSNIVGKRPKQERVKEVLKYYQIEKEYILTVGSIEARKNHETLYCAYLKLLEQKKDVPQLVICGYPGWKTDDFLRRLDHDERVKGKIFHYSFTDEELDILYRNCLFTVLPSLYEGWSLTLPESLNYGKFCIASDVAPLREIGQDFIDYVHPYDSAGWAKRISFYTENPEKLKEKELYIAEKWHPITWKECAEETAKALIRLSQEGPKSFRMDGSKND